MESTLEKLNMIYNTFSKGKEVLGIIREQLLEEEKTVKYSEKTDRYKFYEINPVDDDGKMTFSFAGNKFFIKIRIKFQTEEGFNQYSGLLDWGLRQDDAREHKEAVKITNEYKWTENRIFLVENIEGSSKSHIIKDDDNISAFAEIIQNNIYSCLQDSLKSKYI